MNARQAVVRQREVEQDAALSQVVREVEAAFDRVARAQTRLEALRRELLPAAERAGGLAERAAATESMDALRTIRLQVSRLRAQRRHLDAQRSWVLAKVRLGEAVGRTEL